MEGIYYDNAKQAERQNRWDDAAFWWRKFGDHAHADACELIASANARGDRFRATVRYLVDIGTEYWQALDLSDRMYYTGPHAGGN